MKIYVMRHGQTECNKNKMYTCQYDDSLNEIGKQQAKDAISYVEKLKPDFIICSPLKRAEETAEIVNTNNLRIIYNYNLTNRAGGNLAKTAKDDYFKKEYYNYYSKNILDGLEPLPDLFKRVHLFLDDIKLKYPDKNILLVTHGCIIKAIDYYFKPIPEDGMLFEEKGPKNCEIKTYEL